MFKIFAVFCLLTISLPLYALPSKQVKTQGDIKQRSSDALFTQLMADPFLNQKFNEAQIEHLSTQLDKELYYAYLNDPVISQIMNLIEQALAESLRVTDAENLKSMTLITPETGAEIYVSAVKVMRKLGFSEEQIKKAKIFRAKGPVNAYTYGSGKDNVSFVIYDSLLKEVSKGELEGVMGHELGHVLEKHTVKGVALNLLLSRVISLAMAHKPGEDQDTSEQVKEAVNNFRENFYEKLESDMASHMSERYKFPLSEAQQIAKRYYGTARQAMTQAGLKAEETMDKLPPEVVLQSCQKFLIVLINSMKFLEVPKDTINFITKLTENLNSSYRPNTQDLAFHVKVIMNVISRELETSADLFGESVVSPYISAGFDIKMGGGSSLTQTTLKQRLDQDLPTLREETKTAIDNILKQLELSKESTTTQEKNQIISLSGNTHPRDNIRAFNQIFYGRNPEVIALRNPFLRFAILAHQLKSEKERIETEIKIYNLRKSQLPEIAKKSGFTDEEINSTIKQFDFKLKNLVASLAKVTVYIPKVENVIFGLINELGFEKANPRLADYLEFELSQKQIQKIYIDELSKIKEKNPSLEIVIQNLKGQIAQEDHVLEGVVEQLSQSKAKSKLHEAAIQALNVLSNTESSASDYQNAVAAIQKVAMAENRESRIHVDMNKVIKTSADKSEAPSLDTLVPKKTVSSKAESLKQLHELLCVRAILRIVN